MSQSLRINHSVALDKDLELGKRYNLCAEVGIVSLLKADSDDDQGDDLVYNAKFTAGVDIIGEKGEIVRGSRKGSQAQYYRQLLEEWYEQQYAGGEDYKDKDEFYQRKMDELIKEVKEKLI